MINILGAVLSKVNRLSTLNCIQSMDLFNKLAMRTFADAPNAAVRGVAREGDLAGALPLQALRSVVRLLDRTTGCDSFAHLRHLQAEDAATIVTFIEKLRKDTEAQLTLWRDFS